MSGANRAERRRQARARARSAATQILAGAERGEMPVGLFTSTGMYEYAGGGAGQLPPKEPGRHRFMAFAAWVLNDEMVRTEAEAQAGGEGRTYLDHENLWTFNIGCIDCEKAFPDANLDNECDGNYTP